MNHAEILDEALRLTNQGDYAGAAKLWQELSDTVALDVESKCWYLLNERRCRSALGQHEIAQQILDRVQKLDTTQQFRLNLEHARIDDLYKQHKYTEGNERSRRFLSDNAELLSGPQFEDLAYDTKLCFGHGLICANEFAEGLQWLNEILSRARDEDMSYIHYCRGLAYVHLAQLDAAIEACNQALVSNGEDRWLGFAHYQLGIIYEMQHAWALAKQHLQIAESLIHLLDIPYNDIYLALGNACTSLGEVEEAKRYKKLAESKPQ